MTLKSIRTGEPALTTAGAVRVDARALDGDGDLVLGAVDPRIHPVAEHDLDHVFTNRQAGQPQRVVHRMNNPGFLRDEGSGRDRFGSMKA